MSRVVAVSGGLYVLIGQFDMVNGGVAAMGDQGGPGRVRSFRDGTGTGE